MSLNNRNPSENLAPSFEGSWAKARGQYLATKTISRNAVGNLIVKDYDNAKYFWFARRTYPTLEDFAAALHDAATEKQVFLIRGQLKPDLDPKNAHRRKYKIGDPERTLEGPDRSWGVLDVDGAAVAQRLSFRNQCLFYRDNTLPAEFRGVRMVATVTSGTTLKPGLHARLFFLVSRPVPNSTLQAYANGLACVDGSVFEPGKAIYTARPIFAGMRDPIPRGEWVTILDGCGDIVEIDPPARLSRARAKACFRRNSPISASAS
jgi:hypothetical protein